ncbi:MAG: hypothetical protein QM754_20930 [Tepidisphaeraceae bacterium]
MLEAVIDNNPMLDPSVGRIPPGAVRTRPTRLPHAAGTKQAILRLDEFTKRYPKPTSRIGQDAYS